MLGIGNPLGSDDAVGSYVARKLSERLEEIGRQDITAIDTGPAPENYTSVIRQNRPEHLLLVDAADMGLPAGSIRLLSADRIKTVSFSTHGMPLSALISYVQEFCRQVYIIGVQPAQTATGDKLSDIVQKGGDRIVELILGNRLNEIGDLE